MPFLTEISLPLRAARTETLAVDPLVASDLDYCLKTWLASRPGIGCRPWAATTGPEHARISGWRKEEPTGAEASVFVGCRHVTLSAGERMALAGRVIPLRRCGSSRSSRDAARDATRPADAYKAWLRERLVDLMPYARIDDVVIEAFSTRRVLRKSVHDRANTRVQPEVIPVVDAVVLLTVTDAAKVEDWMLQGLGPQKAFGYGAFLPTLDPRGDA